MSRYSSLIQYPRITNKSTISKLIDVFFRGNKGAKIGIIDENVHTTISRDGDGDEDYDNATNIRKASPTSSPTSSSKKPSSKSSSSLLLLYYIMLAINIIIINIIIKKTIIKKTIIKNIKNNIKSIANK